MKTKKEIIENMIKNYKTIVKDVNSELDKIYVRDLNKIIKRAINDFYGTFKPKYYKRKYSLKYMYNVTSKNGFIDMDFSGEYANAQHRLGNDELFNLVFIGGYHGGAKSIADNKIEKWGMHPKEGVPYWRTPYPNYTEWGYPAKQDVSPMERIDDALNTYEKQLPSIQDEVLIKVFRKWM